MKEKNKVDQYSLERRRLRRETYILTSSIFMAGLVLVFFAHYIPPKPDIWPSFLKTLGIALFISGTIAFLQRYFTAEFLYEQIRKELEKILYDAIRSNFNIIEACSKLGIRQIYTSWPEFVAQILPEKLESLQNDLTVVGSSLSGFSAQIGGGNLKKVIGKKLSDGKRFTFCTIKPNSPAARYREKELNLKDSATTASIYSLVNFNNLKKNIVKVSTS
jgi:hypothetical protein